MVARIKRTDIPNWYVLSKYRGLKELDKDDWYWLVSARYYLHLHVSDKLAGLPVGELGDRLLSDIRQDPLLNFGCEENSEYKRKLLIKPHAVEMASWREARHLFASVPVEYRELALRFIRGELRSCELPPDLHQYQPPINRYGTVAVDFSLPEQVLMNGFRALVQEAQRQPLLAPDFRTRLRNPDLETWRRVGVLPYLDLLIWSIEHEVTIPINVYADVIFEGCEEGEDTVRRTTKTLVQEILDGNALMILGAMASQSL